MFGNDIGIGVGIVHFESNTESFTLSKEEVWKRVNNYPALLEVLEVLEEALPHIEHYCGMTGVMGDRGNHVGSDLLELTEKMKTALNAAKGGE